ncbi:HEPN domain-containing protein [Parapedobacter tibetensis]|uniref:HEPN domain-containing protein n=1 Tax=Parapedobacter tibetensis TaxID=2972951 RepID=UPI00214D6BD7|nr:HEPN domain-containing protein [Parapedobacter tibetensis]
MDIDPSELSVAQQAALRQTSRALVERISTSYIFCFALQRHESRCTHCFAQRTSKRWFQADILLVYSDDEQRCLYDIQHHANNLNTKENRYTTVVMGRTEAMERLAAGDAFVCKVFRHGALLYSHQGGLPGRQGFICHETLLQKTREGWRRWFNNSCQFMDCAAYCLVEHNFGMAVFMLHQTVEQACKALLKVMLHMRPGTHNLAWMLKLCSTIAPEIASIFPRENPQDIALFNLLKNSYTDSRYTAGFKVKEEQAWALYYRVSSLLQIAGELSNRRITEMEQVLVPCKD